ncbi:MAG: hypothetical protein JWQ38_2966 [Flavipsychrobacter sp.]|nr:hypothetical protein [Flavipsychrobacter sp.]
MVALKNFLVVFIIKQPYCFHSKAVFLLDKYQDS